MFTKLAASLSVLALTASLNLACSDSPKAKSDAGTDASAGSGGSDAAGGSGGGTGGTGGTDAAAETSTDTATEAGSETGAEAGSETGDTLTEVLPTDTSLDIAAETAD